MVVAKGKADDDDGSGDGGSPERNQPDAEVRENGGSHCRWWFMVSTRGAGHGSRSAVVSWPNADHALICLRSFASTSALTGAPLDGAL